MNTNQLKNIRKEKKLSQKNIYEGLCSQTMFSKIEQGEKEADQLLFYAILGRLGISTSKYTLVLTKEEFMLSEQRTGIELCIRGERWREGEEKITQYRKNDFSNVTEQLHEQYLCFMEAKIAYGMGEFEKAIEKLKIGIGKTNQKLLDFINGVCLEQDFYLSILEMSQFCMFCELLDKLGKQKEHRKELLIWIKNYLEKKIEDTEYKMKFYPIVSYFLALIDREEDILKCLVYCEEGIAFLKQYKSLLFLKEFLELYQEIIKEMGIKGKEENEQYLSMLQFIECSLISEKVEKKRPHLGTYFIGDIIKNTREYVGKTQEQLNYMDRIGKGKADPSTLSKIENGHRKPRKATCEHYFHELGLGQYDRKIATVIGGFRVQELRWQIDYLLGERNFDQVRLCIGQLEEKLDLGFPINEQYIRWAKVVVDHHDGKVQLKQYREKLIEILKITWKDFEIEDEKKLTRLLSRMEITIYINIAQSYIKQEQYKKGIYLYQKLKEYFEEVYPMSGYSSYNFLCMNLEKALGLSGAYDESILQARRGICMEYFYADSVFLHEHLYNIGWNYGNQLKKSQNEIEKRKYKKACQFYLEQALKGAIFMNDLEVIQLIQEKKKLWLSF